MEKKTPHHLLEKVKELLASGKIRVTRTALEGASALGFSFDEMIDVVKTLESTDFYKSMTTYADHTIWQDVYHAPTTAGDVYLKLTILDDVLIISFKEL
jgi:motility quorum-sensing regulator / GCU-specific mRNA interferase toxin